MRRFLGPVLLLCVWLSGVLAQQATQQVDDDLPEEGDLRLVNQRAANGGTRGTLQVFCDGAWGAVCSRLFGDSDALVACRQLGFHTGVTVVEPLGRDLPDEEELAPIVLANPGCDGNETRLVDCPADMTAPGDLDYSVSSRPCDPFTNTYALIECRDTVSSGPVAPASSNSSTAGSEAVAQGSVRLADGVVAEDGSAEYGRLEVFSNGSWGTICRTSDDMASASMSSVAGVVCGLLGYDQGTHITGLELVLSALPSVPVHAQSLRCIGDEPTLLDCPGLRVQLENDYGDHSDCSPGDYGQSICDCIDVEVSCVSNASAEMGGSLRLAEGTAVATAGQVYEFGRLEVFLRGFWSNICGEGGFPPESARVACQGLGYAGGATLLFGSAYGTSLADSPFLVDESIPVGYAFVRCNGSEPSLGECPRRDQAFCSRGSGNDFQSTVLVCATGAGATGCSKQEGSADGAVRLRGGFGSLCDPLHSGFVEVRQNSTWGGICLVAEDRRVSDTLVADVVCRQLGFPHGTRVVPGRATFDEGEAPGFLSLDTAECHGPESSLADCDLGEGFRVLDEDCSSQRRLYVACRQFPVVEAVETDTDAVDGDVRLLNERPNGNWVVGELEIFFEGSWGTICEVAFDAADANVACRQLGFGAGAANPTDFGSPVSARGATEVVMTAPGCLGDEPTLLECGADINISRFEFRRCSGAGVTLACVADAIEGVEGAVRLSDTQAGDVPGAVSGFLEVFHAGAWGTLCAGGVSEGYYYYSPESVEALFDDDFVDVPPVISTAAPQVACRQLGFESGIFPGFNIARFPASGTSPPWLSALQCGGNETEVLGCANSGLGETWSCHSVPELRCFNSSAINGVSILSDGQRISLTRLAGGTADPGGAWEYGRLEVLVNGIWQAIDEQTFRENLGRRGAEAACRSLGYAAGAELLAGASSALPSLSNNPSSQLTIFCDDNVTELTDCEVNFVDFYNYDQDNGPQILDVALLCANPSGCEEQDAAPPADGDLRLRPLDGNSAPTAACDAVHFGGVELFFDGRWGRVCDDMITSALVACRQLGFPYGTTVDTDDDYSFFSGFDYGADDDAEAALVWATAVVCTGKEERLLDCGFPENFGGTSGGRASGVDPDTFGSCSRSTRSMLSVACRRFEVPESDVIR